jgi:hypothetical protein
VTAKPYDPVLKGLVDIQPRWWPVVLSQPAGPTEVIDADIATVSGAADKVLRVGADPPYLQHLEFVADHDVASLPPKLHVRTGLLRERHALRVRSAVVLLHPGADSPQLTEVYQESFPDEEPYLIFRVPGHPGRGRGQGGDAGESSRGAKGCACKETTPSAPRMPPPLPGLTSSTTCPSWRSCSGTCEPRRVGRNCSAI